MIEIALIVCVFGFIATLVYFGATMVLGPDSSISQDRLDHILPNRNGNNKNAPENDYLRSSAGDGDGILDQLLSGFPNLPSALEQSGLNLSVSNFALASIGCFIAGLTLHLLFAPLKFLSILTALLAMSLPFLIVIFLRNRRLEKYSHYLPDALSMMSNALRAGQSLPATFRLVADQTPAPLGPEFARCYDEQNLGIPLEQALEEMAKRAPNVDLKFFATAVTLQRQTGGDLSEILDKIARLIRERFQIHGMIKALTGEGRLSGVVLLSLPPVLMVTMFFLNAEYIMLLFTHPLGQKLLVCAGFMQLMGFFWIKKIINIKV